VCCAYFRLPFDSGLRCFRGRVWDIFYAKPTRCRTASAGCACAAMGSKLDLRRIGPAIMRCDTTHPVSDPMCRGFLRLQSILLAFIYNHNTVYAESCMLPLLDTRLKCTPSLLPTLDAVLSIYSLQFSTSVFDIMNQH
jgi:hypothetical protein